MSRTGNGALIALNAIGKQDQILCDLEGFDKDNSPFIHNHTQFSHYTRYYKSYVRERNDQNDLNWPFSEDGTKVGFVIDPRISGDLLTNMFLKLTIPAITHGSWTDKIGRAIIQSVELRVDSTLVEKLTDIELVVKDELFTSEYDKTVKNYTQNGKLYKNSLIEENLYVNTNVLPLSAEHRQSKLELYIDLGFCFGRKHNYKPSPFPLAAVNKQLVYVDIQFRPKSWFTNTVSDIGTNRVTLVTEQVSVTEQEKLFLQRKSFNLNYKNVKTHVSVQTDKDADSFSQTNGSSGSVNSLTVQLKGSGKTSAIMWAFQNRRFKNISATDELNSNLFLNRYNFSSHENLNGKSPLEEGYVEPYYGFNEVNFPICSKIELLYPKTDLKLLYAGSESDTIPSTSVFFRSISSQSKGLYTPEKNIFSYTFDENPMTSEQSETYKTNLGDYKLFATLINDPIVKTNVFDLHIFTYSSFELQFEDGYLLKKI
jgi:hypothetical protein